MLFFKTEILLFVILDGIFKTRKSGTQWYCLIPSMFSSLFLASLLKIHMWSPQSLWSLPEDITSFCKRLLSLLKKLCNTSVLEPSAPPPESCLAWRKREEVIFRIYLCSSLSAMSGKTRRFLRWLDFDKRPWVNPIKEISS